MATSGRNDLGSWLPQKRDQARCFNRYSEAEKAHSLRVVLCLKAYTALADLFYTTGTTHVHEILLVKIAVMKQFITH